jgi:hypothetical protein
VFRLGGSVHGLVPPVIERWMQASQAAALHK